MKNKKVLVVLGGTSGEREVSLDSGKACIKALKKNIQIKKHSRELLITWKEDIWKQTVIGKEKKFPNINQILNVKDVMVID